MSVESESVRSESIPYREIGAYYDELYRSRADVWAEQGHTPEFTRYLVDLVEADGPGRYLDVGCGEGFFLREARLMEGFGIDLSGHALKSARSRSGASVAIGAAERLPFADGSFHAVTSIGAMEHFLDDAVATREIRRVLRRGGRYVVALLVEVTPAAQLGIKLREFLWPRPRPVALARWLLRKAVGWSSGTRTSAWPQQPVQNRYVPRQALRLFRRNGFRVARQITLSGVPEAPLPGHYMRFYCLEAV